MQSTESEICKVQALRKMDTKRKNGQKPQFQAVLVGESGFEPLKSSTTDLQSAPFGHSGTPP